MKKRIWVQPINKRNFLNKVISVYSNNGILILESEELIKVFARFQTQEITIDSLKHEYGKNSVFQIIDISKIGLSPLEDLFNCNPELLNTIGAIQIFVDNQLEFLAGDNFHRECISFLETEKNEAVVKEIIEAGLATLLV